MNKLVRNVVGEPRCPSCHEWNPKDAQFCIACGIKLTNDSPAPSAGFTLSVTHEDKPGVILNTGEDGHNELDSEQVQENTAEFFKSLRWPTMKWLKDNDITQRSILIVGGMEAGKSSKADEIIHDPNPQRGIIARYGRKNVAVQKVQGENLAQILEAEKWPRKLIQVIVIEDCTDKIFQKKSVAGSFELRHKLEEKTGLKHGLVITIMTVHSLFKIPDEFRTVNIAALLFCDIPTAPDGTFHHGIYERFIPNKDDREFLRENAELRLENRERCGFAAWTRWGVPVGSQKRTGIIYLPAPPEAKKRLSLHFGWPARGGSSGEGDKLFTRPVIALTVVLLGIMLWQIIRSNWLGLTIWVTVSCAIFGLRFLMDRLRTS